jgi:hypothetical protein
LWFPELKDFICAGPEEVRKEEGGLFVNAKRCYKSGVKLFTFSFGESANVINKLGF